MSHQRGACSPPVTRRRVSGCLTTLIYLSPMCQVLKKRLAERKDDMESCVLLLRKLGEADDTLQVGG